MNRLWVRLLLVGVLVLEGFFPAFVMAASGGKFQGVIKEFTYLNVLVEEEQRQHLAEIEVEDGLGERRIFVIDRDTQIKSPEFGDGKIYYLKVGMKVKVAYRFAEEKEGEEIFIANSILVKR